MGKIIESFLQEKKINGQLAYEKKFNIICEISFVGEMQT